MTQAVNNALKSFYGGERVVVLATLIRAARGDFDAAEDALADAISRAVEKWPVDGIPERPGAWILTVARRLLIDGAREGARRDAAIVEYKWGESLHDNSDQSRDFFGVEIAESLTDETRTSIRGLSPIEDARDFAPDAERVFGRDIGRVDNMSGMDKADDPLDIVHDERLALLYTCCHPALAQIAQLTLALRTIGGLSVREIARALLEPEATTAQRLVRTKHKIRHARVPFEIPFGNALRERTDVVRETLYLVFNEGYSATEGDAYLRVAIAEEAIRLARLVTVLTRDDAESLGLLALMLLHHARRSARTDETGVIISLEDQDRSLWDRDMILEGEHVLDRAIAQRQSGPYQLQAAIAALHATAPAAADTDWRQIAQLYGALRFYMPTPVVELNAAVALAMVHGPDWGLAQIDALANERGMADYHLLPAARADLLRRAGRKSDAAVAYAEAIRLTENSAERRYLERRVAEVTGATG